MVLEAIWLSFAMPRLYRPAFGHLMEENFKLGPAALFYFIYFAGIVVLAVQPGLIAHAIRTAALMGACLGFVAYATYYLTNLATLRGWPSSLAGIDLAWGTFATSAAATSGYLAATHW